MKGDGRAARWGKGPSRADRRSQRIRAITIFTTVRAIDADFASEKSFAAAGFLLTFWFGFVSSMRVIMHAIRLLGVKDC